MNWQPLRTKGLLAAVVALIAQGPLQAQLPVTAERVASGFSRPVLVTSPPNDERLFVLEQFGRVEIIKDGEVLPIPFIDMTSKLSIGGERGLMGMAFHPNHAENGYVYFCYTNVDGNTVVERYSLWPFNDDILDVTTATTVIGPIVQPGPVHNGGSIAFGPEGMLYVGVGDGGGGPGDTGPGHAPQGNGQSPLTLLAKILRLNVDAPFPHIPIDNPYVGDASTLDPIWALGVREPWRFTFDRLTGDFYLGDVGGGQREEVDYVAYSTFSAPEPPVLNFGWRCQEGTLCTGLSGCTCGAPELTPPLEEFDHSVGCAMIGGYIYRGCAIPQMRGVYLYAAFCYTAPSRIFGFRHENGVKGPTFELTAKLEPEGTPSIGLVTSFGEDANGELYICDLDGEIYRIVPETLVDCNNNGLPDSCDLAEGRSLDLNFNRVPDECEGLSAPRNDRIERVRITRPGFPPPP